MRKKHLYVQESYHKQKKQGNQIFIVCASFSVEASTEIKEHSFKHLREFFEFVFGFVLSFLTQYFTISFPNCIPLALLYSNLSLAA